MTTNVMDRRNRKVTSDSRWSAVIGDDLYFVDDTGFDKIAERPTAVMVCAGNAALIALWKAYFLSSHPPFLLPPTTIHFPNGTFDSIALTILKKPDFTIDFTCGLYDAFEDAARFCGSGASFAKSCYSVNGCCLTCIESAKAGDPKTGGEIKYYDFNNFQHNLSSPAQPVEHMSSELLARGMVMNTTGNATPMDDLQREALKKALGTGTASISAPTGLAPRVWTEQEKEDVQKAMQRIREREQAANC